MDANARFARDDALAYADALAPFRLRWFEEPTDPHDYALMAELAARYVPPLATGENLYSTQDVVNLARFGGWRPGRDVIQVDPPQAYGIVQFARTLAALKRLGYRRTAFWPHGGNQMSLHVAAGLGLAGCESYPGVFGAFGGFADDARIEDGMIDLPDRPGIGFEAQTGALRHHARRCAAAMSDAAEPLLDADHAALIQSGVSIVVASRDATNAPRVARALGCRVSADRRRVTVYLGAFQAAPLLAAIRAEGAIAVAFNLPSTHRALELKGTDAAAVPLDRSDVEHAQRYVDAFAADIGLLGYAEAYGRALLWFDPAELTGIAFTPAAAFEQTPGPRAGVRLGS